MPDFDAFYLETRRDLLLQTFALTGDLTASRAGVHDAYVKAHHHWRKVRLVEAPLEWVRPRAWTAAQRRAVGRIWHRVKDADDEQRGVLKALSQLPETQRKLLLLTQLSHTPPSRVGREVGLPLHVMASELEQATGKLSRSLRCEPHELSQRIRGLEPLLMNHGLPRASSIRRQGQARRRRHVVGGIAAAVVLTATSGWFVSSHGEPWPGFGELGSAEAKPVTQEMLLDPSTTGKTLTPAAVWTVASTGDNTSGSGLNMVCQRERFADPNGEVTWVRHLRSPARSVVQSVEVSSTPGAAVKAFDTAAGWYAGCTSPGVQLSRVFAITGVGDQARAFKLVVPQAKRGSYWILLARNNTTVTTVALLDQSPKAQKVDQPAQLLARATDRLCNTDAVPNCTHSVPQVHPILPPKSGEGDGMLATADLPPITGITKAWIGTPISATRTNVARTICDNTNFAKLGASKQLTRTFLVPQAKVPARFGLTEIAAQFRRPKQAQGVYDTIVRRLATCEDRRLGTKVTDAFQHREGTRGTSYALWRVTTEINADKASVSYWMGIAVAGRHVSQVNFTPAGRYDLTQDEFRDLVARSRDRLLELATAR